MQYFENNIFNAEDFRMDSHESAEFVGCHFIAIDMSEFNFGRLKFLDCEFVECNLSNVSLQGASFRGVAFKKSKLIGLNWAQASTVASCSFSDSILDYGVFHSMNLKSFLFNDCKMLEVEFAEAQLTKASFCGSMLRGCSFNKANLTEADFRGASEYFIDVRYSTVKKAKFSMPDAISLLSSLEITLE